MKSYIPKSKRYKLLTIYKRIIQELKSKDPLKDTNMMLNLNRKAFRMLRNHQKRVVVFSSVKDEVRLSYKPRNK